MRTARQRLTKTAVLFVAVLSLVAATAAGAGAEPPEQARNDEAGENAPPEQARNDEAGENAPPEQARNDEAGENAPPEQAQNERDAENSPAAAQAAKVTICHATSSETNPFVMITVSVNAITPSGHAPHQDGSDIIPPFEGFDGQNWDAEGQAIFEDGCVLDDGGDGEVESDVELTSLTAVCVGEDAVIRFAATSTIDADGVVVSLLDGAATVDTETVDFDAVTGGDGFEADGEFPYPATIADALTVSLTVDGDETTGVVPAAPSCLDGTTVLPGPVVPAPSDEDETDVGGDEVVNVPVPDLTPSQPVAQPVAQPTTVDRGPAVLGETVTRGALARTGASSISVLALAGMGLLLLGLGLRRSGRRAMVG